MEAYRDQYASLFKGGRNVVLLAISSDPAERLSAWARDDDFPFLFGSDPESEASGAFGAGGRSLFVVDPQGRVAYRALPFREVDPTAYEELGQAIDRILGNEAGTDEGIDAER